MYSLMKLPILITVLCCVLDCTLAANKAFTSTDNTITTNNINVVLWPNSTTCSLSSTYTTMNNNSCINASGTGIGSVRVTCSNNTNTSAWNGMIYTAASCSGTGFQIGSNGLHCLNLQNDILLSASLAVDCSGVDTNYAISSAMAVSSGTVGTVVGVVIVLIMALM